MACKHEGGNKPCIRYASGGCRVHVISRMRKYRLALSPERRHKLAQYKKRYRIKNIEAVSNTSAGAIGSAGELIVGADLMLRGFSVTRPLDPQARHDLHVEIPSVGWKGVQVKIVTVNTKTGTWSLQKPAERRKSPIYALVRASTKEIRYEAGSESLPDELK